MTNELSASTIRSLLTYDTETGRLFWRKRDIALFGGDLRACASWNARFAGKQAFTATNNHGYKVGSIWGRIFTAHRVIWALHYGDWPSNQIDHQNGKRNDNRLSNLCLADNSKNHKNQKRPSTNKTGVIGVHMDRRWGTWRAEIFDNGKRHYLGSFRDMESAVAARKKAEAKMGYHANHGRDK